MLHRIHHVTSKYLLWLLLLAYLVAGVSPQVGMAIRHVSLFHLPWFQSAPFEMKMPSALLALMLFNAGLCMQTSELRGLVRRPSLIIVGILINTLLPCLLIFALHFCLKYWHSSGEVEVILQSLALIIAMPIAGASTAWSQNASGNIALSIGLVVFSTILSPLTTPLAMSVVEHIADGRVAAEINALKNGQISVFLCYAIVLPSLLGMMMRHVIGEWRATKIKDAVKIVNLAVLLLLNYSNAATSLPAIIKNPDWDFLALVVLIVGVMCVIGFLCGWLIPRALGAYRSERVSMMYALGMNNNGSALVIAATAFAGKPELMVPIIAYNLLQHVVAGAANYIITEKEELDESLGSLAPQSYVYQAGSSKVISVP